MIYSRGGGPSLLRCRFSSTRYCASSIERGLEVVNEALKRNDYSTVIVTDGNLMASILKHFDGAFGFKEWKSLNNPNVIAFKTIKLFLRLSINGCEGGLAAFLRKLLICP